jgi:hypothetical protein
MYASKGSIVLPLLIITLGVGWLLTTNGIGEGIDWIWTLLLAFVGIVVLAVNGIDKSTIVVGPFFLVASVFSVLRQTRRLSENMEVPILVIVIGALLLVARHPAIPAPPWAKEGDKPPDKPK